MKCCETCDHYKRMDDWSGCCRQILTAIGSNLESSIEDMCVPADFRCSEYAPAAVEVTSE